MIAFDPSLVPARLIRRYKRFLADMQLADGTEVTAHCANPGSMIGCAEPGARAWLSPNRSKTAKLAWRWELVETPGGLVGINTARTNALAETAIRSGQIPALAGYAGVRREVRYGAASRIDLLLEDPGLCYVEVKNVTLQRGSAALFPDAVTARGRKHLTELAQMVAAGHRAVMLYVVQRSDCDGFAPAADIDPAYAAALAEAHAKGVELLAYACSVTPQAVGVARALPIRLGDT
ncbi:MAG: DNA/RNA nuclease SfsA [Rhodothalassiaceae bacterium]